MVSLQSNLMTDQGFLLRSVDYGDHHRILSFFTHNHGRLDVIALGAKKSHKRFGGLLDFLNHLQVDYQVSKLGSLAQLQEVRLVKAYSELRLDYDRLIVALKWCRLLAKTLHREEPIPSLFESLCQGLSALQEFTEIRGVDLSFRYQTLAALGYELHLAYCLSCKQQGERAVFMVGLGGLYCESCAPKEIEPQNWPFLSDSLWSLTKAASWHAEELKAAQNILTQAYQVYLSQE